jgi:hypothetical protein
MSAPIEPRILKGGVDEFFDRMGLAGADDVIVRVILLQHEPHRFHVLRGIAPIAFSREVAKVELLILPGENPGETTGDLPRYERSPRHGLA